MEQAVRSRSLDFQGRGLGRGPAYRGNRKTRDKKSSREKRRLQRVGVGNEEQLTKTAEKEPRKYSKVKRGVAWKSAKSMRGGRRNHGVFSAAQRKMQGQIRFNAMTVTGVLKKILTAQRSRGSEKEEL